MDYDFFDEQAFDHRADMAHDVEQAARAADRDEEEARREAWASDRAEAQAEANADYAEAMWGDRDVW